MRKQGSITRASAEDLRALRAGGASRSDWAAAEAMTQAEADQRAEAEDGPLPEGWEATVQLGLPPAKQAVHMRLDADVLAWFRAGGPGYQTRINAVLRAFVEARRRAG